MESKKVFSPENSNTILLWVIIGAVAFFVFIMPLIKATCDRDIDSFTGNLDDKLVKLDTRFIKVPEWLTLTQRIAWINKNCIDWDITVEFHLDSWWTATWCSTWYMSWSDFAKKKAEKFQMEYTKQTWLIGRWVHGDLTNRLKRLAFVRDTRPMALLVELGFISNTKDLKVIMDKWVKAIYNSLIKL